MRFNATGAIVAASVALAACSKTSLSDAGVASPPSFVCDFALLPHKLPAK